LQIDLAKFFKGKCSISGESRPRTEENFAGCEEFLLPRCCFPESNE
jgi:hypothetical protein